MRNRKLSASLCDACGNRGPVAPPFAETAAGRYFISVTFTLNFASEAWPDPGPTLAELVKAHRWSRSLVALTVNGLPIEEASFDELGVAEGDRIEAFFLVSGG